MRDRVRFPTTVFIIGAVVVTGGCTRMTPGLTDIPYASLHERNKLDIYLPENAARPYPVVVWIHGGGWESGDKNTAAPFAELLLPHGFAVVGVGYRLSGDAIFPAQIHDCKAAIRWIRANAATYNFDPNRIGAWGASAGGHLASLLGTTGGLVGNEGMVGGNLSFSSRVQAVADYFGPTDLLNAQHDVTDPPGNMFDHDAPGSPESHLIGFDGEGEGIGVLRENQDNPAGPYPELMALIFLASPQLHATSDDPPFFIAHGTADIVVPIAQSTKLAIALTAAGVMNTYIMVEGAGHEMPPDIDAQVVEFFRARFLPVP